MTIVKGYAPNQTRLEQKQETPLRQFGECRTSGERHQNGHVDRTFLCAIFQASVGLTATLKLIVQPIVQPYVQPYVQP